MTETEQTGAGVEPLSAEEIATHRATHIEMIFEPGHDIRCWDCAEPWPCDAARALATIRADRERIARLEAALEEAYPVFVLAPEPQP